MNMQRGFTATIFFFILSSFASADVLWYNSLEEARREAERLNRPILCHFSASWCGPCQKMERAVLNSPEVAEQLRASVVGVKIDIDRHKELGARFGVEQLPTDILIEPNGHSRLIESTGYRSAGEYVAMISRGNRRYQDLLASRQAKPPVTTTPDMGSDSAQLAKKAEPMLMLEGYCPVALNDKREWVEGKPEYFADHQGQRFYFTNSAARSTFLQHPEKYLPQFLGCDPVIVWTTDRAVPGSIEWGAFYDDRLYLFANEENRRKFKSDPDKYLNTRVVLHLDQIESVYR